MSDARPIRSLTCAVAIAISALASADDREARDLLLRSMRQAMALNVVAIVEQRSEGDNLFRKIKLEQCSSGKLSRTVIQPLSMQGVRIFDDGERTFTLLPDERVLIEQASNRALLEDAVLRVELAARNYELTFGKSLSIAGRPTVAVIATPKVQGLPARQIYIDKSTLYPLRVVTVDSEGARHVRVDTKAIYYPESLPNETFQLARAESVRKVRYDRPERVEALHAYAQRLGFAAKLPRHLPFGFVVQEAELQETADCRSAVVRLTDGLALATVYQTRGGRQERALRHEPGRSTVTANGVNYVLIADLPAEARVKLLSAFVKLKPSLMREESPMPAVAPFLPSKEPERRAAALTEEEQTRELPAPPGPQPLHGGKDQPTVEL